MSGGFGAGFFTLTLLAVLAGLAALLGVSALLAMVLRDRSDGGPAWISPLAVGLLVVVVGVAGFGVLVLFDESAVGAGLVVAVVFAPLLSVGLRHRPWTGGWRHRLATAGLAWSLPYLLGVVAFVGLNVVIPRSFDLAPGEARSVGVGWIAVVGAGVVVIVGAVGLSDRVAHVLPND